MIRMIQSQSSGHAKAYFSDALSKSDYYASDQELAGFWQGRLAARIGIQGATRKEDFFALCENRSPVTHDALTPRTKENRRIGYDINFHCPKSVSLLHVFAKDDHILKAFQDSVTETMQMIETDSKTRVRLDNACDDRGTGELVWAHFTHQTARPVEDALPDPHLHSHCFVFNATWDETEQRMKAGQFGDIKRDMPFYQAHFHKNLSDKLTMLGYAVRRTDKSFEIEGVPQKALDLFSKRSDQIGRIAKEKGITDAKELGELGARTRAKKQKGRDMDELKTEWRKQIDALGKSGEDDKTVRFAPIKEASDLTAHHCVDHAVLHCFERASVMAERRLLELAFRQSIGQAQISASEITRTFQADQRIMQVNDKGRMFCTTKEVLAEEKQMVDLARAGQGKMKPLYDSAPRLNLTGQQADAIDHVLTTTHRVSIIRGAAGTGKTTLMKEAVEKINKAGKHVYTFAPTAQASRGVLREEGFDTAETIARLIGDQLMQDSLHGQVIWIDEAGLLGTKDMTAVLKIATQQDAQLILGGDTRQHASVVRGDALRILNTVAGIETAEVSKIYRQKNGEYRAAVKDLSKGQVLEAFEKLDKMDFIKTIDPLNPTPALVNDYMAVLKKGQSALIISPTHAQGEAITAAIRQDMRENGMLGKKEITIPHLKNLNLTEAEKMDHRNFKTGQFVQFEQNVKGFPRGSLWMVTKGDDNIITLTNGQDESKAFPTTKSKNYNVFTQQDLKLSKGDKVMITKNDFDSDKKRMNNGTMLEVVKVSKDGTVNLRNEKSKALYKIDKSFGHITHAHCITSYASQGKTVDEVFIYQPAATFPATDAKQFYVSVSRGKHRATVYTDNKDELLRKASDLSERPSAVELFGHHKLHKDFITRMQDHEKGAPHQTKTHKDHEPDK